MRDKTAEEWVAFYEEFIKKHHEYRKSIPITFNMPKSVDAALFRIHSEAVLEKNRWQAAVETE